MSWVRHELSFVNQKLVLVLDGSRGNHTVNRFSNECLHPYKASLISAMIEERSKVRSN